MLGTGRNNIAGVLATALLATISNGLSVNVAIPQERSLQDLAKALPALPQIVIYQAKEIVTLDPARPTAQAVAVVDRKIHPGQAHLYLRPGSHAV